MRTRFPPAVPGRIASGKTISWKSPPRGERNLLTLYECFLRCSEATAKCGIDGSQIPDEPIKAASCDRNLERHLLLGKTGLHAGKIRYKRTSGSSLKGLCRCPAQLRR